LEVNMHATDRRRSPGSHRQPHREVLALIVVALTGAACADRPDATAPEPAQIAAVAHSLDAHFATWGQAVNVDPDGALGVNTSVLEGCPHESPDGRSLFFASTRAGGHGGIDIWVSHRQGDGDWGEPVVLPAPVNSAADDFCPTPLPGGELLYVSRRPGGCGDGTADIYRTRYHPAQGWQEPEHLGCDVNSEGDEFSPSFVAAGRPTLYFSSNRSGVDAIYRSVLEPGGGWSVPEPVAELNAAGFSTARPNVRHDGRVIVFDSDRPGGFGGPDIWFATRRSVNEPWSAPANMGAAINSAAAETRAALSRDGMRVYFGSNRAGHVGASPNFDLYVATRR
jgi:hypothetical protein